MVHRGNFTISWGYALDYYAILLKKLNGFVFIKKLDQYSKNAGVKKLRVMSVIGKNRISIY